MVIDRLPHPSLEIQKGHGASAPPPPEPKKKSRKFVYSMPGPRAESEGPRTEDPRLARLFFLVGGPRIRGPSIPLSDHALPGVPVVRPAVAVMTVRTPFYGSSY